MTDAWTNDPAATTATAPKAANPWESDLAAAPGPSAQARAVVQANDNGDEAAKALALGKKTGLAPSVVQSDIPGYDAQARQDSAKKAAANPALAKYIDGNPMAASVSGDDFDHLQEVSETMRALGISQVNGKAGVGVFQAVPEIAGMMGDAQGRTKLYNALTALPGALAHGILEFFETPGKVVAGKLDLNTSQGMEAGISFGLGVALGGSRVSAGRPTGLEGVPGTKANAHLAGNEAALRRAGADGIPGTFDDFMATVRGMETRKEIDDFIASKTPGPPGAMLQITKAGTAADALSRAVEIAQESKTRQRSPELFSEAAAAHEPGNVHIDAAKLVELYESKGKVPAEGDGLFGYVPELAAKLEQATAVGGEITIPTAQYLGHIDSAVHETLKPNVRLHDDGVTLEEAKVIEAEIEAWHGTPHDFESFDLTKIGTGEGAQVYGHGLYFAENKIVAKDYQTNLARDATVEFGGQSYSINLLPQAVEKMGITNPQAKYVAEYILRNMSMGQDIGLASVNAAANYSHFPKEVIDEAIRVIAENKPEIKSSGNLVKVSIKADPTKFLDWDKPLTEQQAIFDAIAAHDILGDVQVKGDVTGQEFHDALVKHLNATALEDSPAWNKASEEASRLLAEAGIPGIKYLDQGSRPGPGGMNSAGIKLNVPPPTRNFVVFDDKLVKITEKNGNPVIAAVEAAAEQQKEVLYLNKHFTDAKALGLTEAEFKRYSDKIERAEAYVLERAVKLNRAKIAESVSAEWKRNELAVRDEVMTELTSAGPLAAAKYFRDNKIDIAHERAAQVADDLAPLFGYETGQDLLRGLESLDIEKAASGKGPQRQLADAIKERTAALMEERYGRLAENIGKEAQEIALAHHTFDILADEVNILAKAAGAKPAYTRDEMVSFAREGFEGSRVADAANLEKHQRAVAKNGRDAEKALLKGNFVEALKAKERQFRAAAIAKESLRLQSLVDRTEAKIDRFTSEQVIKSLDQTYLEQIREMLGAVGVQQLHAPLTDLVPLGDFVAASNGQLAVAPWLTVKPPKIADMTVPQFREFTDSLKSLEHVGRQSQTVYNANGKAEVQNVISDIKVALDRFPLIEQPLNPTPFQHVKRLGRLVTAWHLLVEKMLDYTDQLNPNGPITSYIDRPLRDANTKEIKLTEETTKKLRALKEYTDSTVNDTIPQKIIWDKLTNTWLNMDRGNLRQLALYMGARENIKKIIEGFGVNEADVRRLLDQQMTAKDWKWVEGMWDVYAGLGKEASEMVLRDTGVPLAQKTPVPLTTRFGEVTGGYAPLIYDKARSNIDGTIAQGKGIESLFEPEFFTAATAHGYTESLTQYKGFLDLTGRSTSAKIQTMIHDIAFREAVRNAAKIINNEEFMGAMTEKWSRENAGLLPGWLKDIANVRNVSDEYAVGAERVFAGLRQNITSALIALNPGTYMKHTGTAAAMSIRQVGAVDFATAMKDIGFRSAWEAMKDLMQSTDKRPTPEWADAFREVTDQGEKGEAVRQFILASSAVVRNRQRKPEDSVRGAYESVSESGLVQTGKNVRSVAMNIGRLPVAWGDTLSAMPTWLAAYRKAVLDGAEHADAAFVADKEMSRAHGSNFVGDKPRVLRTGEAMRWVTPLYNFWNHNFNNHIQLVWDLNAKLRGDVKYEGQIDPPNILNMEKRNGEWYYKPEGGAKWVNMAQVFFWISVVPIIVHALAAPPKDSHGDNIAKIVLKDVAQHYGSMLVGVRDASNFLLNGYDPSIGTIGTLAQIVKHSRDDARKTMQGKRARDGIAHSLTLLGAMTGVGGLSPGKTIQFGVDVARDKDRPKTLKDVRQGLRTGHSKARDLSK